ncbi:MAG: hypothetical protein RL062_794 [Bacteroidota bacterium]
MSEIQYLNEHLWPGMLGHFFVVLAFVSALGASVAYYFHEKDPHAGWLQWGRRAFYTHAISVVGIVTMMLLMLFNHYYEYKYAFEHLNDSMPLKYMLSCLWEGQEGSFILWIFWHAALSLIVIRTAGEWESRVMTVIASVQVFLASMLLGVYFGDFQFGADPFILLRDMASNANLPWVKNPDYLSLPTFQDGKGLNPLLQNYWMTIHPPTLFLGFASTLIPFAFAIAGLWKRDIKGWMKPAIPWAFFGVMILGTGILMGGAWAYEALGFGGFWAWDPVENASLVPWLTLVGGAHLLLINRRKPTSAFTSLILILSSFILVLYSTFLTRSGVLGDSSVHSFVDSGILAQLLVYLLCYIALSTWMMMPKNPLRIAYLGICAILFIMGIGNLLTAPELTDKNLLPGEGTWIPTLTLIFMLVSAIYLWIAYRRYFKTPDEEEEISSREFWMFIGSVILILMSIHVTVVTSVNVGNILLAPFESFFKYLHETAHWDFAKRLADHQFSAPSDKERFFVYHRVQIPLSILLFTVIALGQYLSYKSSDVKTFFSRIAWSFGLSIVVMLVLYFTTSFQEEQDLGVLLLVWATIFATLANLQYAARIWKGGFSTLGASIAHIGFAVLILGAVVSTARNFFISENKIGNVAQLDKEFNNMEDLMILQGDTIAMGDYFIVYKEKYKDGSHLKVKIDFLEKLPIQYQEGTYRSMQGMVFRCMHSHQASDSFLSDWQEDSLWSVVPTPIEKIKSAAKLWQPGKPGELKFSLEPSVLQSRKGNSREPSIQHTVGQDLYTYIKYVALEEPQTDANGYLEAKSGDVQMGQTIPLTESIDMTIDSIVDAGPLPASLPQDIQAKRAFVTIRKNMMEEKMILVMASKNGVGQIFPSESKVFKMLLSLVEKDGALNLTVQQHKSSSKDLLIISAEIFPGINLLWLGCIIMVIGSTMAIFNRMKNR